MGINESKSDKQIQEMLAHLCTTGALNMSQLEHQAVLCTVPLHAIYSFTCAFSLSALWPAVMSSQASQESVLKAFEAGAKDYLIKPVRRNELATLWQHVWRVNRDLLPQHGSKLKMLPARAKPYSSSDQSTEDTQLYNGEPVSSLQLLCEVASNEQASTSQALSPQATNALDRSRSCIIKHASTELQPALDPVELHIRPLDVAPAHPSAQRAGSGMLPAQLGPNSGSLYNMPAALRELAALGNRLEQERTKQRSSDEEEHANGSDAANALRHSESTSPFQSFTAFVPRPCSRGDTDMQPAIPTLANLQQLSLTATDPARAADPATRLTGHPQVTPDQQQQFFRAFQAAVEQHQLAVEACAVNRKAAIAKFREKRKARNFNKKVSRPCCCCTSPRRVVAQSLHSFLHCKTVLLGCEAHRNIDCLA